VNGVGDGIGYIWGCLEIEVILIEYQVSSQQPICLVFGIQMISVV